MNDNVEIIRSNKGGMKIIHRGYMYTVHKKRQGGGIRWRCTQRSLHCKGSISTGNGPPSVNMPHNHIPDPHSVFLARCRQIEDLPDVNSLLETEYDEAKDSMPLQQRLAQQQTSPQVQISNSCETRLQSQPLSPTKLKVTRQSNKSPVPNSKSCDASSSSSTAPEEVCLRWNSHHSNMQMSFPNLLEKEQYVDVTIIAEGQTIKCHKMILSSCSTYFEEILNGITPLQHPVIILNNTPFWIIRTLINFMYIGEVNIDQNRLPELLDIAELLKVKGLAGKSNNSNPENDKKEAVKKLPIKDTSGRQSMIIKKIPQICPTTITKLEDIPPINDPLDLLEPKFTEEDNSKTKDRIQAKKILAKKFRKRKSSDYEPISVSSPPLFPMRRGTRSRPNVKVPRYYDYEDIVKPTSAQASDIQPFSPIVNIKTEPVDEDEEIDVCKSGEEDARSVSDDDEPKQAQEEKKSTCYRIKIKSLSSLSDKVPVLDDYDDEEEDDVIDTSCSIEVIKMNNLENDVDKGKEGDSVDEVEN